MQTSSEHIPEIVTDQKNKEMSQDLYDLIILRGKMLLKGNFLQSRIDHKFLRLRMEMHLQLLQLQNHRVKAATSMIVSTWQKRL